MQLCFKIIFSSYCFYKLNWLHVYWKKRLGLSAPTYQKIGSGFARRQIANYFWRKILDVSGVCFKRHNRIVARYPAVLITVYPARNPAYGTLYPISGRTPDINKVRINRSDIRPAVRCIRVHNWPLVFIRLSTRWRSLTRASGTARRRSPSSSDTASTPTSSPSGLRLGPLLVSCLLGIFLGVGVEVFFTYYW